MTSNVPAPSNDQVDRVVLAADTNGDGKTDVWMVDATGDGTPDVFEFDTTGDGKPDVTLIDADHDGVAEQVLEGDGGHPVA
jgi:hypothetical protein